MQATAPSRATSGSLLAFWAATDGGVLGRDAATAFFAAAAPAADFPANAPASHNKATRATTPPPTSQPRLRRKTIAPTGWEIQTRCSLGPSSARIFSLRSAGTWPSSWYGPAAALAAAREGTSSVEAHWGHFTD